MHQTLSAIIRNAATKLVGIDNPQLDARLLIGQALNLDRAQLLSQSERMLTLEEITRINALIARRAAHEPVARILGEREFWSLPFGLNEATLEPRPDSETLVEAALNYLRTVPSPSRLREGLGAGGEFDAPRGIDNPSTAPAATPCPPPAPPARGRGDVRLLDLGTGTGCLLLALLHELPDATGLGIDIAPRAVEQAQKNAERLGLTSRSTFKSGNWLDGIKDKFDAILSNPPYIPAGEIASLMPEVRDHDPLRALDGGADGLDIYRQLIPRLPAHLNPEGLAIFELGAGQADIVAELFEKSAYGNVRKHKDLQGIERCVSALRPAHG